MTELAMKFHQHVKANSRCMVCGSFEHITFHHIKPADKFSEVCKVARTGDLTATVNELNKTIPICEMDHTRIHRGKLSGWLDGHFDNGAASHGQFAYQYSPYLNWLARKRPQVFREFHHKYIRSNQQALAPIFNIVGATILTVVPSRDNVVQIRKPQQLELNIDRAQLSSLGRVIPLRGLDKNQ
jgi:hypothetical protein